MTPTAYVDSFAGDHLPPRTQWPELRFDLPELQYPERLNCVTQWVDRWIVAGQGSRSGMVATTTPPALITAK